MSTAGNTESGSVLVTTLFVLAILTALGFACLSVADLNTLMTVNDRESKTTFFYADSGVNIGHIVLERALETGNASFYNSTASDWCNSTLDDFSTQDYPLSYYVSNNEGTYVRAGLLKRGTRSGTSIQTGSGYEGLGKSVSGGTYAYYLIRSHRNGKRNSRAEVDLGWKHINN